MKKIDVSQLATEIRKQADEVLQAGILEIIEKSETGQISRNNAIASMAMILKQNAESFTVSLLQKVVDEMQNDLEDR